MVRADHDVAAAGETARERGAYLAGGADHEDTQLSPPSHAETDRRR